MKSRWFFPPLHPSDSLCPDCSVPPLLFKLFFWLGYCNSTMNPIMISIMNPIMSPIMNPIMSPIMNPIMNPIMIPIMNPIILHLILIAQILIKSSFIPTPSQNIPTLINLLFQKSLIMNRMILIQSLTLT